MTSGVARKNALYTSGNTTAPCFRIFNSIEEAKADWDKAAPPNDLFLRSPYLASLEAHKPDGMRLFFMVFYQENTPVGVALAQLQYFSGKTNYRIEPGANLSAWQKWLEKLKKWIASRFSFHVLVCGNLLVTGDHAAHFDFHRIRREQAVLLLDGALTQLADTLRRERLDIPVLLYKDLQPDRLEERRTLRGNACLEFVIQPNMVLPLPFETFDDYLGAMTTKYRTRAKRAFKKAVGIEKRELTLSDVLRLEETMYALYKSVSDGAGFNMVSLNPGYFAGLKRDLPDDFRVFGYYEGEKLISFFTTIGNHDTMEAHFLGYDKDLNHDKQLYLNMLYDIVRVAISSGYHEVVFARTALEIKSSVGAEPRQLCCFVRHESPLINRLGRRVFRFVNSEEQWVQRHPFKEH